MHILPWSWYQLYLFLRLAGLDDIQIHEVDEPKPKHFLERVIGLPLAIYCRGRERAAKNPEEKRFWRIAGSKQSMLGRSLVVSGRKNVYT